MKMHSAPEGSSISRYETLKQVEKSTGRTPPELLNTPSLSRDFEHAWEAYTSLREYTYTELDSYVRLTGCELDCWEVEAVMTLAKYRGVETK
jgi:hypothetical protein